MIDLDNFVDQLDPFNSIVQAGVSGRHEIASLPDVFQTDTDELLRDIDGALGLGINAVLLFGLPLGKDKEGADTWDDEDGVVQRAARAAKKRFGDDLVLISDVCFCAYTDHGHCGVLRKDGALDNDRTLENLQRQVVSHADAGVDLVAPSGMIDGAVLAIRDALDEAEFTDVAIMAYAAKFASAFYGPFRDAAHSTPEKGDRRGYQMDPANAREALHEIELDDDEGADILMVKPALAYLDVIAQAREEFVKPIAAYQVSGEYAMIGAAAQIGAIDREAAMLETLTAIKRAGADLIVTYFARDFAKWYAK